jgi:Carboxypeptidase regulatory-like domain
MKKSSLISTALLTLTLTAASALASPTGVIIGSIKDQSGAAISGAQITLVRTDTNTRLTAKTDANGAYQFPQLAPANYALTVEAIGFKKVTVGTVVVQVDQITRVDLALEVGAVTELVEVQGATPILETDKNTLSSVVDSRTISNMPLNARQFLDLALLTPGVLPAATGTQGGGFNVAGARSQSNVFLVDGVSNTDTQVNSPLNNFRITDAVQEFAVQTSVSLAEFGRGSGGQINVVTKSGTNQFHGSAFEYLRNTVFDSADFFTNKLRAKKADLKRNQFGATVGGPVFKDKTFFFLSYEGFRQVAPTVSSTRVPTDAERATVTDPISKRVVDLWPRPNTQNPNAATNFIANIAARNSDNTGLVRLDHNFSDRDRASGRFIEFRGEAVTPGQIPQNGGNSNAPLSRSFVLTETHTFSPNLLNEFRFGASRNKTQLTVQDADFNAASIFLGPDGKPLPGVVDGTKDPLNAGVPTINVTGFARIGTTNNLPQGRITQTWEIFDNVSYVAPFGWTSHSWRWGFHIRREDARRYLNGSVRGSFNFVNFADFAAGKVNTSTIRTGETVGYLRRYPFDFYWQDQWKARENFTFNYGVRYEYPSAVYETRNHGANFVPGVGMVLLNSNQLLDIDPTKKGRDALVFRTSPVTISKSGVNPDKNNFAPVLGFAYTPRWGEKFFGKDSTVIRAGFRVGYDEVFNNIPANQVLNPPYNLLTAQNSNAIGKFPWAIGFTQSVPLISNFGQQGPAVKGVSGPTVGVLGFNAIDPNIRSAYLYQYNLGIQRKLGNSLSVEVDYQGSTGHKLGIFVDANQPQVIISNPSNLGSEAPNEQVFPNKNYGAISFGTGQGNSNYNGVVFTGKYAGRKGQFFQASYTLGKSIDNNSAFFGSLGEASVADNRFDLRLERGPSSFDVRHRFVGVYVLDVPIGPGHKLLGWENGFNRQVFGGWQISGITTIQSGAPFTVFLGGADRSGFNQGGAVDRPDVVGSGSLRQSNRNPDDAFDKKYFATPPSGRVGTSGRNQYYGPGIQNWDFQVAKNFPLIGEATKLTFKADFFNVFNHTNFSNPVSTMSSSSFGTITQTVGSATATAVGTTGGPLGGPRLIQLSLRLQF